MVAAVDVTVAAIDDIPAGSLQVVLGTIYGKAQYAADTVGQVQGQAQWAADTAGEAQGTAQYAADAAGFLDYHVREIAALVGHPMPAPTAAAAETADQPAE